MMIKKSWLNRILEIVPGSFAWAALIIPVVGTFFWPIAVASFVILYDLYWLYKAILMGVHLLSGFRHLQKGLRVDWRKRLSTIRGWRRIYHAFILATYKENLEVLRASVRALLESDYPKSRIIFVLATEERDKSRAQANAQALKQEFGSRFFAFLVSVHRDQLLEVKAKGANVTAAAKELKRFLDNKNISYKDVVVTTADADTRVHSKYLACLTYHYKTIQDPVHSSFQPIPLYANNIWYAPAISRVLAFGSTFWQIIEADRPWRLINFSTHAMSMKTLVEMDYWDTTVVNEDSRQFWRAYFRFSGKHRVIPLYLPVFMDAVLTGNFWQTLKSLYQQRRRWAYGAEHFPYVVIQDFHHPEISFSDRLIKTWRLFEAGFSWATASFFIAVVTWLPILLNPKFQDTVLAVNMPLVASFLLTLTWVGLAISTVISLLLLPPRPRGVRKNYLEMALQWILVPITAIFFSSLPAVDAQTRLMLGRYLGFQVTEKHQRL